MKDGGPAFPEFEVRLPGEDNRRFEPITAEMKFGMSLRDYFAAKSLQGLRENNWPNNAGCSAEEIAELAYLDADAMIKERAKKK